MRGQWGQQSRSRGGVFPDVRTGGHRADCGATGQWGSGGQVWPIVGLDCHQIEEIWDFLRSVLCSFWLGVWDFLRSVLCSFWLGEPK